MSGFLPFEKDVEALEQSAATLRVSEGREDEARELEERARRRLGDLYGRLSPWQRTLVARHPNRPHFVHFARTMFDEFVPLAGDRCFGEDAAILGGLARFKGRSVMLLGHQKGEDMATRIQHNFAMARPEGYRKAIRLMALADRFALPVIALVDTPGAFPGIEAEARGQAEAIAQSIRACLDLRVPLVAIVIGEGGSGGAIAIAAANRVLMLEHAVYSVISPEGCASILWRSASHAPEAAEALKLTAQDLLRLGAIHKIVYEPPGGAHRDHDLAISRTATALAAELAALDALAPDQLRADRRDWFLRIGSAL